MNARRPAPLAHVNAGLTIPWVHSLASFYEDVWREVTVEVGRRYGRLVVQFHAHGAWFELYDLPADVATLIEKTERSYYESHRDYVARERDRIDREQAAAAEWEGLAEYRYARGL